MKPVLQVMPLALLFAGAAVGVWRGFSDRNDRTPNRHKQTKRKFWG